MPRREVIEIPGFTAHPGMPIPLAVKIGNLVFTGSISGRDPTTDSMPDAPEEQVRLAFANLRRVVELAGGTTDDIAKVDVRLKDMALREAVNREWVAMFPDAHNRPVRHTTTSAMPGNAAIQLEMTAVL